MANELVGDRGLIAYRNGFRPRILKAAIVGGAEDNFLRYGNAALSHFTARVIKKRQSIADAGGDDMFGHAVTVGRSAGFGGSCLVDGDGVATLLCPVRPIFAKGCGTQIGAGTAAFVRIFNRESGNAGVEPHLEAPSVRYSGGRKMRLPQAQSARPVHRVGKTLVGKGKALEHGLGLRDGFGLRWLHLPDAGLRKTGS